jgi:hypothetical protein
MENKQKIIPVIISKELIILVKIVSNKFLNPLIGIVGNIFVAKMWKVKTTKI